MIFIAFYSIGQIDFVVANNFLLDVVGKEGEGYEIKGKQQHDKAEKTSQQLNQQ